MTVEAQTLKLGGTTFDLPNSCTPFTMYLYVFIDPLHYLRHGASNIVSKESDQTTSPKRPWTIGTFPSATPSATLRYIGPIGQAAEGIVTCSETQRQGGG